MRRKSWVLPMLILMSVLFGTFGVAYANNGIVPGVDGLPVGGAAIGGTIWLDGKPAAGFKVKLDPTGSILTTKEDGRYNFTGLPAGFYVVRVFEYDTTKVKPINGRDYSNQTTTNGSVERAIDLYFESVLPPTNQILATYILPELRLGEVQNAKLPGSIANDRGFLLGGVGSDMWRAAGDKPGEFWLVTDRGPNGQISVEGANRRTFPVPEFTPLILKVKVEGTSITVLETVPIVGQSGKPVTGLSNITGFDETPYDYTAQNRVPFNPNGLDSEGLVRTKTGDFWLCDEYSPSILKVDSTGKVVKRYIPQGLKLEGTDYPIADVLPAIYGKRKVNRGFEGLAISADEKTLYIALQSPLLNPNTATGNASRNTRILVFDIATEKPIAEYVYQFEVAKDFDTSTNTVPADMKLSSVIAINPTTLLINERTDFVSKLYLVDMTKATNILGSKWSDPATTPTLESLADPTSEGIQLLPKTLVIDLDSLPGMPDKIEGVSVIDRNTIAVINDNDFDIGDFDANGNNINKGAKTKLLIITLAKPLPLP